MQASIRSGNGMYGFLACTVEQYMTRPIATVNTQATMRERH